MRTALSSFPSISPDPNATSFTTSNNSQHPASLNAISASLGTASPDVDSFDQGGGTVSSDVNAPSGSDATVPGSNADASIRSKRSPIQEEPKQGINQSWGDFQKAHFEWNHGRPPATPSEISPDEGKLPSPSGWHAVGEWVMGLLFGGPGMPEEGFKLPAYRSTTVRPELAYRPITVRPEEVEDLSVGKVGSTPTAEIKKQLSTEGAPPSSLEHAPSTSSPASRPEDFELKNLDTRHLTSRFNIYYRPGENQEYVQVDGKWYATAEEQGQRFVYQPNEEGVASTWPLREDNGEWRFASLHELPGRPILSVERIPSSYRVDVPTDLQDADAQGVYRAGGQEYIKMDGLLYRSGQDGTGRYIYDSNPSHRIAVQRSDQGWTFTPPSRGLGGGAETPTETVKEVFDMTTERAQAFLSQYRFDAEGPYTERNFVRELNDTFQVPGWADRFRVEVGASSLPAIPAMASHPAPPGGRDVINPISGQLIHIDKGGYLNSSGFIERKDVPQVYRAIDSVTAGRNDPTQVGFRKSYRFRGVSKMIRGPSVIASADRHGPDEIFGVLEDWLDHYAIYRIDAKGLKSVSLRENIKSNPGVMEQVFNLVHGVLSKINAIPDEASRTQLLDDLTIGAYSANEVHVENEYLDPSRVSFEEGSITFELPWSEDVSSPDSAKTWTPPGTRATPSPAGTTISFPPEAGPSKSIPRIG